MRTLPVAASVGHDGTIRKKKKSSEEKNRGNYTAGGARNSANV